MPQKKETKEMKVVEGEVFSNDPTPQRTKLVTLVDCRREMARVYRDARAGHMNISDGTRLIYMLGQIGRMIESSDIEKRIEVLERLNNGKI
ncbi:hypothetical protein [Nitrosomonas sp.]|uniref:hypothetical protein n=1 Tax=Nitrosomonas sp. TaxID=42353 RepID=UPI001DA20566|nr:hypothetical protein [Nitrosomonas sp.]MBX9636193.1 hypothetical protein [Nitrosomonas sp.]MBY0483746.1 hypothetical protein [Nitrosomonas sp.]